MTTETPEEAKHTADTGDLWWIAHDPESGFESAHDAFEVASDWNDEPDEPVELSRAVSLPNVWAIRAVLTRDEAGDPDETEVRLYATEAEAQAAISKSQATGEQT